MAHTLRGRLTAMATGITLAALRGNAEVALFGRRSADELRGVLADGIEEFDRLSRIADNLLLLARADAGQEFIRRAPFRLDLTLADVVDLFSPTAEDQGVDLALPQRNAVWIDGDDGRLRQMIGNLLDNAIKFTPAGGRINVSLVVTDGIAELSVRDTGCGIPPEHIPRISDRFYRVDRARSRDGTGGAGLGLSICHTIVAAHGGSISITSETGKGTMVAVRLPSISGASESGDERPARATIPDTQ